MVSSSQQTNDSSRGIMGPLFNDHTTCLLLLAAVLTAGPITRDAAAQGKANDSQSGQPPDIEVIQTKDVTVITLAGVGPRDKDGRLVGTEDFAAQFKQTWENVRRLLLSAGAVLKNIATITVYTTDAKWQETFTTLQQESFDGWTPATSFAVAQQLRTPGALLEIDAVAVIESRKPAGR
jgi:enamine deaminase RidA (YjgF/YER057c/UK114 family)